MMSLTSLVDEGLNKVTKKQNNNNQIILTEVTELYMDETFVESPLNSPKHQETDMIESIDNCQLNSDRFSMENANSFATRFYGRSAASPVQRINSFSKPRSLSESIVETKVEEHIKYLDDQNDLIFGLVNEKAAVDQMLNR